jgi:hypothetical protein
MKSKIVRWVGCVVYMRETKKRYIILAGRLEKERLPLL